LLNGALAPAKIGRCQQQKQGVALLSRAVGGVAGVAFPFAAP